MAEIDKGLPNTRSKLEIPSEEAIQEEQVAVQEAEAEQGPSRIVQAVAAVVYRCRHGKAGVVVAVVVGVNLQRNESPCDGVSKYDCHHLYDARDDQGCVGAASSLFSVCRSYLLDIRLPSIDTSCSTRCNSCLNLS